MRLQSIARLSIIAPALCLATGPTSVIPPVASAQAPSPCESRTAEIFNLASMYSERARNTLVPFDIAKNTGRVCGTLLKGISQLQGMGCPSGFIDQMTASYNDAKEALDYANEQWDFTFSCFNPDFS